ncbi:MAG: WYL domain-containing protein [Candidatus Saccharicenans sp.]|uniref:WYL domain-containing protein n=1 Tax=Candidatus Saccharicenans sp. TaxID=2819258 RepID=UPI00404B48EA
MSRRSQAPVKPALEFIPEFRWTLDLLENTNKSVFITGRAGTGKSTLLDYFRNNTKKNVVVLAPTGVAALNVGGQTIHSFFAFRPDITLDRVKKLSALKRALIKNLDAMIIDEISMVRADLLDCVDKALRLNREFPDLPFGGLQMILIGDLYQLPPVVTNKEKSSFLLQYDSPYFFSARAFNDPNFELEFIELEKVFRQKEASFLELLNAIRNRSIDEQQLARLNARCRPDFVPPEDQFYITLTSTNEAADRINEEKLERLPGAARRYMGVISGDFDPDSLPTAKILAVKEGAQVMLLNNDAYSRWVNGSIGRVEEITEAEDKPDVIMVRLQDDSLVDVLPHQWEIFEFEYDRKKNKIVSRVAGTFTQYPLRLAWAVTIHKSQGKTFDRVVVDIGRGAFAHGQVYVALSRCTSFRGLVLKKPIKRGHILMDYRVVRFLTHFQYRKAEEHLPVEIKRQRIQEAIKQNKWLDITYLKPDDTKSRRRVQPLSLETMEYRGRIFEALVAYCLLRKEERCFRLDRILDLKMVETS